MRQRLAHRLEPLGGELALPLEIERTGEAAHERIMPNCGVGAMASSFLAVGLTNALSGEGVTRVGRGRDPRQPDACAPPLGSSCSDLCSALLSERRGSNTVQAVPRARVSRAPCAALSLTEGT
jgi:hypothetical protein